MTSVEFDFLQGLLNLGLVVGPVSGCRSGVLIQFAYDAIITSFKKIIQLEKKFVREDLNVN